MSEQPAHDRDDPDANPNLVLLEYDQPYEVEVAALFYPTSITGGAGRQFAFGNPQPMEGVQVALEGVLLTAGDDPIPAALPLIILSIDAAIGLRDMLASSINYHETRKAVVNEGFVRLANIVHNRMDRDCAECAEMADDGWPRKCLCGEGWIHASRMGEMVEGEEWVLVCESCEEPRWE